jgi:hypothetical protein
VTEADWLAADPQAMLESLRGRASDRKLRLFNAACCRLLEPWLRGEKARQVITEAERFADGAPDVDLGRWRRWAARSCDAAVKRCGYGAESTALNAVHIACIQPGHRLRMAGSQNVLHHVFGDEFRTLAPGRLAGLLYDLFGNPFRPGPAANSAWLAWNGGTVPRLAAAAYQERKLPSGHLDAGRLALLADALEDAGCADPDLLGHLRSAGPHARGCWAVDLLTSRS